MVYKYSLILILILVFFYGTFWVFNHLNAWLGIFLFIFGVIFLIDRLFKLLNNSNNA